MEKKIIINDKMYNLNKDNENYLIYQYCFKKGIELPCFCYNENLEIAGNCRICLVEISTSPKLVLSCATKIIPNMIIKTQTKRLKRVRQSIMEFLLINHPLDCPICDQGGECDLQNITQIYGLDRGRFYEFAKRSVLDKESGFFIKTIMTRCIHCTRCVRFFKEIENLEGFGIVGRGEDTEIVTKKENLLSILSGNVVDICPVGALTSKLYTFSARPWELNKYENIDILNSMCSSICLDLRNNKILRILPVSDSYLNLDWISNITRYFFDSLYIQRLLKPFIVLENTYLDLSWSNIIKIVINKLFNYILNDKGITFFLYDFLDLNSMFFLKNFNLNLGFLNIILSKNLNNNLDFNFFFFFNTSLKNFKNYLNYFFVMLNLRLKLPLLNARLRLNLKKKKCKIFSIGFSSFDVSFDVLNLGNCFSNFIDILKNKSKLNLYFFFNSFFFSSYFSLFNLTYFSLFIGENFYYLRNSYQFLINFIKNWNINIKNIFNLFTSSIDLHYQELYLKNLKFNLKDTKFFYNFYIFSNKKLKKKKNVFSVLQNSFFNNDLKNYNVILPVTSFFEYKGIFLNFEGRLRQKLKIYSYNNFLKNNVDILKFFNIILLKSNINLYFLNFVKFFKNLLIIFYDFFFFYKKILIIFNNFNFNNLMENLYKYCFINNFYIFEYLINAYHFKNIYKNSFSLNKASIYFNTYIHTYVI